MTVVLTPLNKDVVAPVRFPPLTARLIALGKSISHPVCLTKENESDEIEAILAFPKIKLELFKVAPEIHRHCQKLLVIILKIYINHMDIDDRRNTV